MNNYEIVFRKIFKETRFENPTFVGCNFYGRICDDLRVCVAFDTDGAITNKYSAIVVGIINRNCGLIDSVSIPLKDVMRGSCSVSEIALTESLFTDDQCKELCKKVEEYAYFFVI